MLRRRMAAAALFLLPGTVAVFGQLTSVKAALLTGDMPPPGSGESKVRLIQAIPGEAAVDRLLAGVGLAGVAGFVVQQRHSTS